MIKKSINPTIKSKSVVKKEDKKPLTYNDIKKTKKKK
jgi:hypothetical protein